MAENYTRYCARCGAQLVSAVIEGHAQLRCPECGFVVHHNPAPVGLAVVEYEGELVFVRRTVSPLKGYWAPPAGHVEIGESVPDATIREVKEETGLEITLNELIGVYSQADVNVVLIAYRGKAVAGELRAGDDASEIASFAPDELPRQPFPTEGTAFDRWFYQVIESVTKVHREEPLR